MRTNSNTHEWNCAQLLIPDSTARRIHLRFAELIDRMIAKTGERASNRTVRQPPWRRAHVDGTRSMALRRCGGTRDAVQTFFKPKLMARRSSRQTAGIDHDKVPGRQARGGRCRAGNAGGQTRAAPQRFP